MRADEFPRYQKFINDRDRALEKILYNAQLKQTDILSAILYQATFEIQRYLMNENRGPISHIDNKLAVIFHTAVIPMTGIVEAMLANTYVLTVTSETEALAQLVGKGYYNISKEKVSRNSKKYSAMGGQIKTRIQFYLDKLRRKIMNAVQYAVLSDEELEDSMSRIVRMIPNKKYYVKPPVKLRRIAEAKKEAPPDISLGFVDDEAWDDMVDDYLKTYRLSSRGPEDVVSDELVDQMGLEYSSDKEAVYEWEVEKEITHEFVSQVREGQIEAANQVGIKDFVWIAVLDKKTCENCCAPRDGLTSKEIEDALESGKLDEEACDAITPPAHMNCRCRLAPVLEGVDETLPDNTKEFEEWLNS